MFICKGGTATYHDEFYRGGHDRLGLDLGGVVDVYISVLYSKICIHVYLYRRTTHLTKTENV